MSCAQNTPFGGRGVGLTVTKAIQPTQLSEEREAESRKSSRYAGTFAIEGDDLEYGNEANPRMHRVRSGHHGGLRTVVEPLGRHPGLQRICADKAPSSGT